MSPTIAHKIAQISRIVRQSTIICTIIIMINRVNYATKTCVEMGTDKGAFVSEAKHSF